MDNYVDYKTQRTNHAEYFDACARFITAPRIEEENIRLQKEMIICKCDLSDRRLKCLHDHGIRLDLPCTYKALAWLLATQLHNAVQSGIDREFKFYAIEKNQARAARAGKSMPWPRDHPGTRTLTASTTPSESPHS